jgi:hypothetical protein
LFNQLNQSINNELALTMKTLRQYDMIAVNIIGRLCDRVMAPLPSPLGIQINSRQAPDFSAIQPDLSIHGSPRIQSIQIRVVFGSEHESVTI